MNKKKQIRLAIVDDHNLFRKGLIKLINMADRENKYQVLFEAFNGRDMKDKLKSDNLPDIILMDIDMPDMNGYEAVEWLRQHYPDINILIVSMFATDETIIRMLRLGAKGYLSKDIEVEDMHMALEAFSEKGFYYSDSVACIMADMIQHPEAKLSRVAGGRPASGNTLTENEKEFLEFACTELTYQQIADKMNLSVKTIDNYRENLFSRFNVKTRVSLAVYAIKHGLVKI